MADIEEIKKRLDIVQIISEYLPLKKAGISYKAQCPFHTEKTPSFTVSPERGTWHCFGCNEGGDVISFVQKIDGLEFREVLERLATRAGVALDNRPEDSATRSEKTVLYEVMDHVTRLYHELLLHHASATGARAYIKERGISDDMIVQFRLGFAPNAWHTIDQALAKKNLSLDLAWKSGLSVQKAGNRAYDRFRNRLMFPIDEPSSRIIGFTGRMLGNEEDQAKYVNTAESQIFKKSDAVYGISHAKQSMREQKRALMVEGQMDCLTAHQFGFTNAVATSGTALTEGHIRLLKRYTDTVAFAFDNDVAGRNAALNATRICFELEVNPLIVTIPHGKDPDESIRSDKVAFARALEEAKPAIVWFLNTAIQEQSPLNAIKKKAITRELLALVRLVKNSVEQAEYIQALASALGVPESAVAGELKHASERLHHSAVDAPPPTVKAAVTLDLERQIMGLLFAYYHLVPTLPPLSFENTALGELYKRIQAVQTKTGDINQLLAALPKDWQERLNTLVFETLRRHELLDETDIAQEIAEALVLQANKTREARVGQHARAIADAFSRGDKATARELLKSLDSDTIKIKD